MARYLTDLEIIEAKDSSSTRAGVFVTLYYLNSKREEHLRGCIGFPLPGEKLGQSVVQAAIAAATEDPRFPPISLSELDKILFEVSFLSEPQRIRGNPTEFRKEIKIGRDGLVIQWKYGSGLLLPQVPVELQWNVDEFMANICFKAGAPPDVWVDPQTKLHKFQATVFKELEPKGRVKRLQF